MFSSFAAPELGTGKKIAAARFFTREVLPRVGADRRIIENTVVDLMDLSEDAF